LTLAANEMQLILRGMETKSIINDEFLTVKQAAAYLKRTPGNIYNLIWAGKLRCYKPGGRRVLFKRAELQEWVEGSAVASNDEIAAQAASR